MGVLQFAAARVGTSRCSNIPGVPLGVGVSVKDLLSATKDDETEMIMVQREDSEERPKRGKQRARDRQRLQVGIRSRSSAYSSNMVRPSPEY